MRLQGYKVTFASSPPTSNGGDASRVGKMRYAHTPNRCSQAAQITREYCGGGFALTTDAGRVAPIRVRLPAHKGYFITL